MRCISSSSLRVADAWFSDGLSAMGLWRFLLIMYARAERSATATMPHSHAYERLFAKMGASLLTCTSQTVERGAKLS